MGAVPEDGGEEAESEAEAGESAAGAETASDEAEVSGPGVFCWARAWDTPEYTKRTIASARSPVWNAEENDLSAVILQVSSSFD